MYNTDLAIEFMPLYAIFPLEYEYTNVTQHLTVPSVISFMKRHLHLPHDVSCPISWDTACLKLSLSARLNSVLGLGAGLICSASITPLAYCGARVASVLTIVERPAITSHNIPPKHIQKHGAVIAHA